MNREPRLGVPPSFSLRSLLFLFSACFRAAFYITYIMRLSKAPVFRHVAGFRDTFLLRGNHRPCRFCYPFPYLFTPSPYLYDGIEQASLWGRFSSANINPDKKTRLYVRDAPKIR